LNLQGGRKPAPTTEKKRKTAVLKEKESGRSLHHNKQAAEKERGGLLSPFMGPLFQGKENPTVMER